MFVPGPQNLFRGFFQHLYNFFIKLPVVVGKLGLTTQPGIGLVYLPGAELCVRFARDGIQNPALGRDHSFPEFCLTFHERPAPIL